MITTFAGYNQNITDYPNPEQNNLIADYFESYKPKICCLESYWSQGMTNTLSMKPFLKAIGWMLEKDIIVAHRMIDSGQGLAYYTKFPNGIIWKGPQLAGIDVFYLASHGKPGGLKTPVSEIDSEELISAFNGLDQYNNIVFFGGCEVFAGEEGRKFATEFLRRTKTVAVVGYTEDVSYLDSLLIDTLFISRFFETSGNPFEQLQSIYDSVVKDYPRTKSCGFSIFLNKDNF